MKKSKKDPFAIKYHRDGSITAWNVYIQSWVRTDNPSDELLSSFNFRERARVERHLNRAALR